MDAIADDLNLDVKGQDPRPRGRQKKRFSHDNHLYHALLALIYGHMFFEQVGEIGTDGLWHLRKLAERMPKDIAVISVAEDGGLIEIQQKFQRVGTYGMVTIPVSSLVGYIWEMEGANWAGRSMFRDCYRNWLIKDRLIRVDAINHEKAGGVPVGTAPKGASHGDIAAMAEMARNFKVGENAGGALPPGGTLEILKAGNGTDVVGSIKYHDESMARMFLHMFIQLGQTETGSRALGANFVEYAFIAQKAVAQWYVDITNAHVIEDWVDWNYGPEEQIPLLTYIVEDEDENLAVAELVDLVGAGLISVDQELEDTLRERYNLPRLSASQPDPGNTVSARVESERSRLLAQLEQLDNLTGDTAGRPSGLRARMGSMFGNRS